MYFSAMHRIRWYYGAFLCNHNSISENDDFQPLYAKRSSKRYV